MEGYAIAFDKEAYRSFTPLAERRGLSLCPDAPEQISRRDGFEDSLIYVELDFPGIWIDDLDDNDDPMGDEF